MRDVLVFYATTEGQTRRIAERIASDMRARGFNSRTIDVMNPDGARVVWDNVRGVILGASLHAGRHQHTALAFTKAFRHRLNGLLLRQPQRRVGEHRRGRDGRAARPRVSRRGRLDAIGGRLLRGPPRLHALWLAHAADHEAHREEGRRPH
jgi:hypothetical protein